jgi:septal ring factor EnvC (AmiA/AmiB activator)
MPLILLPWVLIAIVTPVYSADDLDSNLEKLAGIEQRLEKTLAEIARNETVESDVLGELDLVDQQLSKLKRRVASEKKKLQRLDKKMTEESRTLRRHKEEVADLQVQVQKRLVAMYKSEKAGALKTLFSAQNFSRLFEDYDYLGRVILHDRELLDDFRSRIQRQQVAVNRLATTQKKQQKTTADLNREEQALKRTVRLKKRYLAAIRKDNAALDRVAADLKAKAERLTVLVSELEARGSEKGHGASLFALQKGFLPWPVQGRLKHAFGSYKHAELGTLLDNHGIDIFSEPETGVKAVWGGRIAFAKRFMGYGNLIIIDHGDGYYSLYAQVQKLLKQTNDKVEKGDLIAYTGFEGADHVYFEIRKGRTPIDPLPWMEKSDDE